MLALLDSADPERKERKRSERKVRDPMPPLTSSNSEVGPANGCRKSLPPEGTPSASVSCLHCRASNPRTHFTHDLTPLSLSPLHPHHQYRHHLSLPLCHIPCSL
ncbi:hypothetical protein E2C01_092684 [Portunus trituberculatus]|uniref:Uncharacterized protein n=1 Tax=Portunus trituberculatus TaxID=210409 RepID=A0A5B7JMP7_PORTR|nr:hypothetical protein [Portunus trituberculatus]